MLIGRPVDRGWTQNLPIGPLSSHKTSQKYFPFRRVKGVMFKMSTFFIQRYTFKGSCTPTKSILATGLLTCVKLDYFRLQVNWFMLFLLQTTDQCDRSVVGNLFTTAGRKRVAISVAGLTNNSSEGAHNINPYHYFFLLGPGGPHKNCSRGCPPL